MSIPNEQLEHRVDQQLVANKELSSQRIVVTADDGIVTLQGDVQSFRRKLLAQQVALNDGDVREVRNKLVVETPSNHLPVAVAELVNQLLDKAEGLSNESIVIVSHGCNVTVSGYVASEQEKARVEDLTRCVDGVQQVTNLLLVNPDQVSSNRIHCEEIVASISEIIGLDGKRIRLAVVNETARLSGRVDSMWMKEAAETTVRRFGILTLRNEILVKP